MKLTELSVTNYRAIRSASIPLSRFGCLIGENNSGKSSFLQTLALFFSGTKLAPTHFFDESKPIRIAVAFESIDERDLLRLAVEHRERVRNIVKNGKLVLVRHYDIDGKSALLHNTLAPNEARFSPENIATLLRGQRPGAPFVTQALNSFPELNGFINATMNQEAIRQRIQDLANALPENLKAYFDLPLPTGIDRSILPMLPEPIYIPAVKDLADDIKTTESTPFGKILAILLQAIESKLPDAQKLFQELDVKLNRVHLADGTTSDGRLDEIKLIESTIQKYVRESFASVILRLAIPPPEMKTVFSSAKIFANDGVDGLIESKGDGLRRAIVFSILRAYVELKDTLKNTKIPDESQQAIQDGGVAQDTPASYFLMFEEPELFLHPKAQQILFDALRVFSKEHHVIVTTHSPMFFGPSATETFVKLYKVTDHKEAQKPFTKVRPIDLSDMAAKDQFQIICFENNNAAFFAETVVLVEGDSDFLLMPHIAKVLNPAWDTAKGSVLFVRITGKGNIRRYRDFFSRFGARTPVISDLDLLTVGFAHINPTGDVEKVRAALLQEADKIVSAEEDEPTTKEAKDAHSSGELRGLWRNVLRLREKLKSGECTQEEHDSAVEDFFGWQRKSARLDAIRNSKKDDLVKLKYELLDLLRCGDVYVLERGAIEDYYPQEIGGADKPARAQDFCSKVTTREAVLACCSEQPVIRDGVRHRIPELDLIFQGIFGNA